jgi:hypothetical protein
MRGVGIAATMLVPVAVVAGLLWVAAWRDRRRQAAVARQVQLTDAIGRELGAVVAPVVSRGVRGPWRVAIAVPLGHARLVARVLAIAQDTLADLGPRGYEIVLRPQAAAGSPAGPARGRAGAAVGRLRAA